MRLYNLKWPFLPPFTGFCDLISHVTSGYQRLWLFRLWIRSLLHQECCVPWLQRTMMVYGRKTLSSTRLRSPKHNCWCAIAKRILLIAHYNPEHEIGSSEHIQRFFRLFIQWKFCRYFLVSFVDQFCSPECNALFHCKVTQNKV